MAKYLKKFQDNSQYEAYTASTVFITPNVSYCVQEDEVYFNPSSEPPTPVIGTAITYSASSKLNVSWDKFTPAATAETFADGVGKIEFSEPVTAIGNSAFYRNNALTSIAIPNSVTSIGKQAFCYCGNLRGVLTLEGVERINEGAFYWCSGLTSVIIGSEITSIGGTVFSSCRSLTSITVKATTPPTLPEEDETFDLTNNCPIYVPSGSVNAYKSAWRNENYDYSNRIQPMP